MTHGLHLQIDLGIVEHPKMLAVSRENRWAWIDLLAYCKRNLTDGFVPEIVVARLGILPVELTDLTFAGLIDRAPGGWFVHDFLDWNASRAEVEEIRDKRASSGRIGGIRSGQVRAQKAAKRSNEANAKHVLEASRSKKSKQRSPETETETETETTSSALVQRAAARVTAFDAFWSMYPRKIGKRTAQAAYARAIKRATEGDILAALQQQIPTWTDPQYIPHPTTWLNRDGWNDQPDQHAAPASLLSLAEDARRLEEGRRFFA